MFVVMNIPIIIWNICGNFPNYGNYGYYSMVYLNDVFGYDGYFPNYGNYGIPTMNIIGDNCGIYYEIWSENHRNPNYDNYGMLWMEGHSWGLGRLARTFYVFDTNGGFFVASLGALNCMSCLLGFLCSQPDRCWGLFLANELLVASCMLGAKSGGATWQCPSAGLAHMLCQVKRSWPFSCSALSMEIHKAENKAKIRILQTCYCFYSSRGE